MERRWYWGFTAAALLAAGFTVLSLSRDWTREWHAYQQGFSALEAAASGDQADHAEILGRSHRFNQIVVDGGRVDRCTTCHLGMEDPRFETAPHPYRTHPTIPEHRFEKFGCTLCHGGQGRATTVEGAHQGIRKHEAFVLPGGRIAYVSEREDPLRPGRLVQGACGSCHMGPDVPGAPLLLEGKRLFMERGCLGCHQVAGIGGKVGPELTLVGAKRSDPAWHAKHLREPDVVAPGSVMPSYRSLDHEEVVALTAFLLSLRQMPTGLAAAVPLSPEAAPKLFPPLRELRGHWDAPPEESRRPVPVAASPESLETGRRLYLKYCASCHGPEGGGDGPAAPDLKPRPANFADPHMMGHETEGSLFWKIGEGRRFMPPWKDTLTERERWSLAHYLRTLAKPLAPGMPGPAPHAHDGAPDEHEAAPHEHGEGEDEGHPHGEDDHEEDGHGHGAATSEAEEHASRQAQPEHRAAGGAHDVVPHAHPEDAGEHDDRGHGHDEAGEGEAHRHPSETSPHTH